MRTQPSTWYRHGNGDGGGCAARRSECRQRARIAGRHPCHCDDAAGHAADGPAAGCDGEATLALKKNFGQAFNDAAKQEEL